VQFRPMKRLRRSLFNGITALSLLMCIVTAVCWILSFFVAPNIEWDTPSGTRFWAFDCVLGEMRVHRIVNDSVSKFAPTHHSFSFNWMRPRSLDQDAHFFGQFAHYDFRFLGFGAYSIEVPTSGHHFAIFFWPCWGIVLITLPLPALRAVHRRRGLEGHCQVCGYDLRATPDRCPECGTIPPKKEIHSN